jgi:MraZ protein
VAYKGTIVASSGAKWDNKSNMLIGEYIHTIDSKKRISLPSKIRKNLGRTVVLTRGLDNCVFVYALDEWEKITKKMADLSMGQVAARNYSRFLFSRAEEIDIDSSGRILIPDHLKEFAHLDSSVVIAGVHNRLELWDENRWKEYTLEIERDAGSLAERLGEVGMI